MGLREDQLGRGGGEEGVGVRGTSCYLRPISPISSKGYILGVGAGEEGEGVGVGLREDQLGRGGGEEVGGGEGTVDPGTGGGGWGSVRTPCRGVHYPNN